jgi:enoyl-CoA hydratase/carnithine racemase
VTSGIGFAERDGVLEITLDRPPDNLWDTAMLEAAMEQIQAASTSALIAIRLRATGEAFCLGRERQAHNASELRAEGRRLADTLRAWTSTPLLTLAEVHGDAAGFGANLVGLADVAIASRTAQLSFPEIRGRLAPTLVLSWLPAHVGYQRAMELVTTGQAIDAATACSYGLVNRVVAPEELAEAVDGVLATWREVDPIALRDIKRFAVNTRYWPPDRAAAYAVEALALSALGLQR